MTTKGIEKTYDVMARDYRGIWITFMAGFDTIKEAQTAAQYARTHGTQYNINGERILFDIREHF